mgnify:CR=1 FL=1
MMTRNSKNSPLLLTALIGILCIVPTKALAQETIDSSIGKLSFTKDFENGYPTDETVKRLYDEMDDRKAR